MESHPCGREARGQNRREMLPMSRRTEPESELESLSSYRGWFYAAAIYNLAWGAINGLWPTLLFDTLRIDRPNYLPIWQVVGMFVLVYAPAYWWAARYPDRYPHLIAIGLFGKLLGPLGFVWSIAFG